MQKRFSTAIFVSFLAFGFVTSAHSQTKADVRSKMKKAANFFVEKVARHGGYVYYTSPDLKIRLGEGPATDSQVWVQPPGTPTVGMAFLTAYEATSDSYYLSAALKAGQALIQGQLPSGAWTNNIDFSPEKKRTRNFSTLDDDISQSAIRFMLLLDKATQFKNKPIHDSTTKALDSLLAAQFPNGAFPQGWDETLAKAPANDAKASFPSHDWKSEGRIKDYWDMYTLNDGLAPSVSKTLNLAHQITGEERFLTSLKHLGNFLILAQMPEPQPAWAQQYNYAMEPIWARKFEPAAIAGRETEGVIATLLRIAACTEDTRLLKPVPAALAWLKRSELPNGKLARYYELQSNKPLYMARKGKTYSPTHDDSNLPSHYGWKNPSRHLALETAYNAFPNLPNPILPDIETTPDVTEILSSLNDDGAWISTYSGEPLPGQPKFKSGEQYIHSGVFSDNLTALASFLKR